MSLSFFGQQLLANILAVFVYGLVLPLIFSWGLTVINRNTKQLLANRFGVNSQVILGALGIIVHESSHLLMAVIFGHKITKFRLIKLAHPERQGVEREAMTLGYVNHGWNSGNAYQTMGNFFIGFAPIVGVSGIIFGLTAWLLPQTYSNIVAFAQTPDLGTLFQAPLVPISFGTFLLHFIIWVILVTNLSVGGFDLSSADLKNSANGLTTYVLLLGIIALAASVFLSSLFSWFALHLLPMFIALLLVIIISGIVNGIVRLVTRR